MDPHMKFNVITRMDLMITLTKFMPSTYEALKCLNEMEDKILIPSDKQCKFCDGVDNSERFIIRT